MAGKPRSKPGAPGKPSPAPSGPPTAAAVAAGTAPTGAAAAKDLAQRLQDPAFQADIEKAVRELPPERAAELVAMLEASMRRRKLELLGYLAAAAIVVVGMVGALIVMGSGEGGTFLGWVFLIPLALAGLVMWLVGKKARASQPAKPASATSPRRPS